MTAYLSPVSCVFMRWWVFCGWVYIRQCVGHHLSLYASFVPQQTSIQPRHLRATTRFALSYPSDQSSCGHKQNAVANFAVCMQTNNNNDKKTPPIGRWKTTQKSNLDGTVLYRWAKVEIEIFANTQRAIFHGTNTYPQWHKHNHKHTPRLLGEDKRYANNSSRGGVGYFEYTYIYMLHTNTNIQQALSHRDQMSFCRSNVNHIVKCFDNWILLDAYSVFEEKRRFLNQIGVFSHQPPTRFSRCLAQTLFVTYGNVGNY